MTHTLPWSIVALALALSAAQSPGGSPTGTDGSSPSATIAGGADHTGHHYVWKVRNHRLNAAIEEVRFPVYAADLFFVPDGWEQEMINRCHLEWQEHVPSFCIARKGVTAGILPGSQGQFGARIAARGALVGEGTVTIRYVDGTVVLLPGVQLPVRPGRPSNYMALLGGLMIFGGWVVWRELRRRRPRQGPDAGRGPESDSPPGVNSTGGS